MHLLTTGIVLFYRGGHTSSITRARRCSRRGHNAHIDARVVVPFILLNSKEDMMSHNRMRSFNKLVTNRITHRFASFSRGPFALIRHVGRRSGKSYETPIMVEPVKDGFIIALTYGESVDWYRNVLAAGHCTLRWHGREYTIEKPEPVDIKTALPAFPLPQRLILRLLGTQHFVKMQHQVATPTPQPANT